jgi:Cu(I)/Ag(I) efflux system protein CusF
MKSLNKICATALLCLAANTGFAADAATGKGVIVRVDVAAGIANINHEAIPALKWPAMTMDFKVPDKQQLAPLKAGQSVTFGLVKDAKHGYVISHIEVPSSAK